MKIIDIEPNTPEWLDFRRTRIGASDISIIMGLNPWKTELELYHEKIDGKSSYINAAMQRGHDLEPIARKWLEESTHSFFNPLIATSDEYPFFHASFDAISNDHQALCEIKCPGNKSFDDLNTTGKIPIYYQLQCQWQMYISNLSEMLLLYYTENDQILLTIERDDKLIDKMIKKGIEFYTRLINLDPPKESKKDYIELSEDFEHLGESYRENKELERLYKTKSDEIKDKLLENLPLEGNYELPKSKLKIVMSTSTTVDWKKLCKDKGITDSEIEKYSVAKPSYRFILGK